MKEEIRDKWVAALRSGEFVQGHYTLYDFSYNSYCCLGVLCELHRREFRSESWILGTPSFYFGHESHLPPEVIEWLGIEEDMYLSSFLMGANDSDGWPFAKIARYIEAYDEAKVKSDDYYSREEE